MNIRIIASIPDTTLDPLLPTLTYHKGVLINNSGSKVHLGVHLGVYELINPHKVQSIWLLCVDVQCQLLLSLTRKQYHYKILIKCMKTEINSPQ